MSDISLPVDYTQLDWQTRREVREQYAVEQKGLCMFCQEPLDWEPSKDVKEKQINWDLFPPNFLKYPIHLQHSHSTGMTEGAVHAYCNAVLWQYHNR